MAHVLPIDTGLNQFWLVIFYDDCSNELFQSLRPWSSGLCRLLCTTPTEAEGEREIPVCQNGLWESAAGTNDVHASQSRICPLVCPHNLRLYFTCLFPSSLHLCWTSKSITCWASNRVLFHSTPVSPWKSDHSVLWLLSIVDHTDERKFIVLFPKPMLLCQKVRLEKV